MARIILRAPSGDVRVVERQLGALWIVGLALAVLAQTGGAQETPTPDPSPTDASVADDSDEGALALSIGAIVGIAVGSAVALACAAFGGYRFHRRRAELKQKRKRKRAYSKQPANDTTRPPDRIKASNAAAYDPYGLTDVVIPDSPTASKGLGVGVGVGVGGHARNDTRGSISAGSEHGSVRSGRSARNTPRRLRRQRSAGKGLTLLNAANTLRKAATGGFVGGGDGLAANENRTLAMSGTQRRRDDPNDYDASSDEEEASLATSKYHNRKFSMSAGALSTRSGGANPTCTPMQRLTPMAHCRANSVGTNASSLTATTAATTDDDVRSDGAPTEPDALALALGRAASQQGGSTSSQALPTREEAADDTASVYSAASSHVGAGARTVTGVRTARGLRRMENAATYSPRSYGRHPLSLSPTGGGPRHRHLDSIVAMSGNNGGRALMGAPSETGSVDIDNRSETSARDAPSPFHSAASSLRIPHKQQRPALPHFFQQTSNSISPPLTPLQHPSSLANGSGSLSPNFMSRADSRMSNPDRDRGTPTNAAAHTTPRHMSLPSSHATFPRSFGAQLSPSFRSSPRPSIGTIPAGIDELRTYDSPEDTHSMTQGSSHPHSPMQDQDSRLRGDANVYMDPLHLAARSPSRTAIDDTLKFRSPSVPLGQHGQYRSPSVPLGHQQQSSLPLPLPAPLPLGNPSASYGEQPRPRPRTSSVSSSTGTGRQTLASPLASPMAAPHAQQSPRGRNDVANFIDDDSVSTAPTTPDSSRAPSPRLGGPEAELDASSMVQDGLPQQQLDQPKQTPRPLPNGVPTDEEFKLDGDSSAHQPFVNSAPIPTKIHVSSPNLDALRGSPSSSSSPSTSTSDDASRTDAPSGSSGNGEKAKDRPRRNSNPETPRTRLRRSMKPELSVVPEEGAPTNRILTRNVRLAQPRVPVLHEEDQGDATDEVSVTPDTTHNVGVTPPSAEKGGEEGATDVARDSKSSVDGKQDADDKRNAEVHSASPPTAGGESEKSGTESEGSTSSEDDEEEEVEKKEEQPKKSPPSGGMKTMAQIARETQAKNAGKNRAQQQELVDHLAHTETQKGQAAQIAQTLALGLMPGAKLPGPHRPQTPDTVSTHSADTTERRSEVAYEQQQTPMTRSRAPSMTRSRAPSQGAQSAADFVPPSPAASAASAAANGMIQPLYSSPPADYGHHSGRPKMDVHMRSQTYMHAPVPGALSPLQAFTPTSAHRSYDQCAPLDDGAYAPSVASSTVSVNEYYGYPVESGRVSPGASAASESRGSVSFETIASNQTLTSLSMSLSPNSVYSPKSGHHTLSPPGHQYASTTMVQPSSVDPRRTSMSRSSVGSKLVAGMGTRKSILAMDARSPLRSLPTTADIASIRAKRAGTIGRRSSLRSSSAASRRRSNPSFYEPPEDYSY